MSSDLDKLKVTHPLNMDELCRETEYVDVHAYKYFRITSYSDIDLQMDIIFSHDGINDGPISTSPVNNRWQTKRIEVLLNFMKIKVSRATQEVLENKLLVVNLLGRSQFDDVKQKDEPKDEPKEEPKPVEQPIRSKSPFSSILKGRSRSNSRTEQPKTEKIELKDSRLPEFIARNTILVGGFSNNVTIIPPPLDNDSVLVYSDGKFVWLRLLDIPPTKSVKFEDIYN